MTARRRRRSGSGPSATAMIAWAGGARTIADHAANRAFSATQPSVSALVADRPGALSGKFRGFAVGSLLACGSVLAVAVHAGDGAFGPVEQDATPSPAGPPAMPHVAPGPDATPAATAHDPVPADMVAAAVGLATGAGHAGTGQVGHAGGHAGAGSLESSGSSQPAGDSSGGNGQGHAWGHHAGASDPPSGQPGGGQLAQALEPVAQAPDTALAMARQVTTPVTAPGKHAARSTAGDGSGGAAPASTAQRTAAMVEETGQPALSMLSGSTLR